MISRAEWRAQETHKMAVILWGYRAELWDHCATDGEKHHYLRRAEAIIHQCDDAARQARWWAMRRREERQAEKEAKAEAKDLAAHPLFAKIEPRRERRKRNTVVRE